MGKKYNIESVKIIAKEKGYELIDEEYVNIDNKLTLKDAEGYYYYQSLNNLIHYGGRAKFSRSNPYTFKNIELFLNNFMNDLTLIDIKYSKYIKITLKCIEGYYYFVKLSGILDLHRPQPFQSNNPHTVDNIKLWLIKNNKNFTLLSTKYLNSDDQLSWKCLKNGCEEIFTMSWDKIMANRNCPFCSGDRVGLSNCLATKNPELASEWNFILNKNLSPFDFPCGSHQYVYWKCKECGHEWKAQICNRTCGRGCPKCAESKGEKQLDLILTKYNIVHDSQYTFDDLVGIKGGLLRFDVPVFWDVEKTQLKCLIEYDGIFHYEKQYDDDGFETLQIHDKIKNQYCKNNNIKLIRIPYWDFDNIEDILIKELNIHITNNSNLTVVF